MEVGKYAERNKEKETYTHRGVGGSQTERGTDVGGWKRGRGVEDGMRFYLNV